MQKFLIPFFGVVLFACKQPAKDSYTLTGDIKGIKGPYVYLVRFVGDSTINDSTVIKDGHFEFKGAVKEPVMAYVSNKEKYIELFLENADIAIRGNIDSLDNLQITGSATQMAYDSLKTSIKAITDIEDKVYDEYRVADRGKDSTAISLLEVRMDSLRTQRHKGIEAFIAGHPLSPVSLHEIEGLTLSGDYPKLEELFLSLDTTLQNSQRGKALAKQLAIMKRREVGEKAMDFTQKDMQNRPVQFSQFSKGKYVLLDFWASWCGPCRAENPNVLKAYNRFKGKNFEVLGVSLDEDSAKWKDAVLKDGMPWMQVSDLKGWKNEVAAQYAIQAIPFNFLVDTNGVIIAKGLRGGALEKKLAEVLK